MWHVEETTAFDLNNGWFSFLGGVTELILCISPERDGAKERWLLWRTSPAIDELTPAAPGRFQSRVVSMHAAWSGGLQPLGLKPARTVLDDNSRGGRGGW